MLYGDDVLDYLNLPDSTIADKTITKSIFELAEISNSDRKLLTKDVERIVWEHRISQDNTNIRPYCDDVLDYSEIQVISVYLKQRNHLSHIIDLILSSFQYPLLIVFHEQSESLFVVAHVRINQNDRSRLVVEDTVRTKWMVDEDLPRLNFDTSAMRTTNLFDFYSDLFNAIVKLRAESEVSIDAELSPEEYRLLLEQISIDDGEIAKLKTQLKKEDQFNRQMELNNRIKELQKDKEVHVERISKMHQV